MLGGRTPSLIQFDSDLDSIQSQLRLKLPIDVPETLQVATEFDEHEFEFTK